MVIIDVSGDQEGFLEPSFCDYSNSNIFIQITVKSVIVSLEFQNPSKENTGKLH